MESQDYIKIIERKIREIANEYTKKGYDVIIQPSQSQLPNFIKGFEPDIIARHKNENVLIEVKTRQDKSEIQKFESIINEINKRENWRFEVIFTNTKETTLNANKFDTLSNTQIAERINEINKLIQYKSFEAAFLLGWSTLEAVIRQKLNNENKDISDRTTLSVIKTIFSLGLLNQNDYRTLQITNNLRNTLIHGFQQNIDKHNIENILQIINNLTGKNREQELLSWLDSVDLENYEEIYSLYRIAYDKGDMGLFKIEEKNGKYILSASHVDEKLEFKNDEELHEFAKFIEDEYMDDMDPEGWYGFHRAMEKDD